MQSAPCLDHLCSDRCRGKYAAVSSGCRSSGNLSPSDLCLFVCLAKMTKCPHPPRLVELTKWANFPGYGFNLHAEKARQGEKTFFHGHLFPHLVTMDVMNNGTKGIRNTSDSTSLLMVIIKLNQKYKWRGHAWFFFS